MKRFLLHSVKVLFAGFLSGLVLGVSARLAMAGIAFWLGVSQLPSLGGTLEVVATGLIIGIPAAIIYALIQMFLQKGSIIIGALFGLFVFILLILFTPPSAESALVSAGNKAIIPTLIIFGVVFVIFGIVLNVLFNIICRQAS